jgi:hypothetical protein
MGRAQVSANLVKILNKAARRGGRLSRHWIHMSAMLALVLEIWVPIGIFTGIRINR